MGELISGHVPIPVSEVPPKRLTSPQNKLKVECNIIKMHFNRVHICLTVHACILSFCHILYIFLMIRRPPRSTHIWNIYCRCISNDGSGICKHICPCTNPVACTLLAQNGNRFLILKHK